MAPLILFDLEQHFLDWLQGEVAYTLRHTGATTAMANGVTERVLAELMGHAGTRTVYRYQHPRICHLVEALERATGRRRLEQVHCRAQMRGQDVTIDLRRRQVGVPEQLLDGPDVRASV